MILITEAESAAIITPELAFAAARGLHRRRRLCQVVLPERDQKPRLRSGSHFSRIVVPQAERVSPRLAVGCCGKAVVFRTEDCRGLIVNG